MKKNLLTPYLLALAVLACALLLDGCQVVEKTEVDFDLDSIAKAQQIVVSDPSTGAQLRVLESQEDIEAFVEAVDHGWRLAELPEGLVREGAFTLWQQETVTALIGESEARTIELCTLYSYRDAPYLTIDTGVVDLTFSIPDSTAEYLHSFLS